MYKITKEIRDALIQYLSTRPYAEVAGGIQALQSLKEIKEENNEEIPA